MKILHPIAIAKLAIKRVITKFFRVLFFRAAVISTLIINTLQSLILLFFQLFDYQQVTYPTLYITDYLQVNTYFNHINDICNQDLEFEQDSNRKALKIGFISKDILDYTGITIHFGYGYID